MRRLFALILLLSMLFVVSCSNDTWKGFYDEDLSRYLTLGDYKGMKYSEPDVEIDLKAVDEQIALMLEAATEMVESDGKAAASSAVKIDSYCFLNGVSTPELSLEGQTYYIDVEYDDVVVDTVRMACFGAEKGDAINIELTLPAGYKGIIERDTNAEFKVTVLSVYEKVTPKLTDSTAPILMPGCNSVAELRDAIFKRLQKQCIDAEMDKVRAELKKQLLSASVVKKMPVAVLNDYYEDEMTLYRRLADAIDMPLEEYAEKELGMTASELENMVAKRANDRTKEALVLYSVVKAENIAVSDALLSEYAEKMALKSEEIFKTGEEYLSYYGKNAVTEDYLWEKVIEIILKNAEKI